MRLLKTLIFSLLVLLLVLIVSHFLGPKTYHLKRSITLEADAATVWDNVDTFEDMEQWEPWGQDDPDNVTTIHGTDGEVGTYSRWEGPKTGVGEQRIEAVDPGRRIDTHIDFIEPWYMAGQSEAYIEVEEITEGTTKVTWGMTGENSFPSRSFALIPNMDLDAMVGPMYEQGLELLRGVVAEDMAEKKEAIKAAATSDFDIEIVERRAQRFITKREKVSFERMSQFLSENINALMTAVAVSGQEISGPPSAIYYDWDETAGMTDMAVAVPVTGESMPIQGYEVVDWATGPAVFAMYQGDYQGSGRAHMAIEQYMKANQKTAQGAALEEYVVGPADEADPSKWVTNIYYPIK